MCCGREVASVVMMGDGVVGEVLFVRLELHGGAEPKCGGLGLALRPL